MFTNGRGETCYSSDVVRDDIVIRTCSQGQGRRVTGYADVLCLQRVWQLRKEARDISSHLGRAPHTARLLAGAAETHYSTDGRN